MKLYFGNMVTTVTTLMIVSLVGFVGYSISNRTGFCSYFLTFEYGARIEITV